jgi:hypothetical protein
LYLVILPLLVFLFFACHILTYVLIFCFNPALLLSVCVFFCPTVATNSYSSWDECSSNLWTLPAFSELSNMSRNDLTHPVAAAATAQVKLCPYDEEEPHIWFALTRLSLQRQGSDPNANANALASLPKQALRDILDTLDVCNDSDETTMINHIRVTNIAR